MRSSKSKWLLLLSLLLASVSAQTATPANENGSVILGIGAGWSFGFPAVRAAVAVGNTSAISPEKKILPAYSGFAGIRVWRFLVPFVSLSAIDTGKATAQVGSLQSQVQANTFAVNGGVRLIGSTSRARPYAQFGGGLLHQGLSGSFVSAGKSVPISGTGSAGIFMYGAGVQFYVRRRWGADIGFDGFRVTQPLNGAGQNFSQLHFGWFFQTKSTLN